MIDELEPKERVTLYGKSLTFEIRVDKRSARHTWREHVYTPEENGQRYEIQQRAWRRARGEETETDLRLEFLKRVERAERD